MDYYAVIKVIIWHFVVLCCLEELFDYQRWQGCSKDTQNQSLLGMSVSIVERFSRSSSSQGWNKIKCQINTRWLDSYGGLRWNFDNVGDDIIIGDTVGTGNYKKASQIAKKICKVSQQQSLDKEAATPYSKQAQRQGIPEYQFGIRGKVDDIGCVVVALAEVGVCHVGGL